MAIVGKDWLVAFDNVNDIDILRKYFPSQKLSNDSKVPLAGFGKTV